MKVRIFDVLKIWLVSILKAFLHLVQSFHFYVSYVPDFLLTDSAELRQCFKYPLSDRLYEHDNINMLISMIWTGYEHVSTNGYQQISHVHTVKSQQNHISTLRINTILWTKIQNYEHKFKIMNTKTESISSKLYKMPESFHRSHIEGCTVSTIIIMQTYGNIGLVLVNRFHEFQCLINTCWTNSFRSKSTWTSLSQIWLFITLPLRWFTNAD